MADEKYNLSYTGAQVETLLGMISSVQASVPTRTSQLTNDSGYVTSSAIPTTTSQLTNNSGFITASAVPTKLSQLTNDSGYAKDDKLDAEIARAQAAEALLATLAQLQSETTRATGAESALQIAITDLLTKVPTQASAQNQLADKNFVNSSIQSNTAKLVSYNGGPFPSVSALRQVSASENDYAYVTVAGQNGTYYDRYKYIDGEWVLEYRVNSTVFTSAQWAAINSNITAALTQKLQGLPDAYTAITTSEINTICV